MSMNLDRILWVLLCGAFTVEELEAVAEVAASFNRWEVLQICNAFYLEAEVKAASN